jgi:hypothetical protein
MQKKGIIYIVAIFLVMLIINVAVIVRYELIIKENKKALIVQDNQDTDTVKSKESTDEKKYCSREEIKLALKGLSVSSVYNGKNSIAIEGENRGYVNIEPTLFYAQTFDYAYLKNGEDKCYFNEELINYDKEKFGDILMFAMLKSYPTISFIVYAENAVFIYDFDEDKVGEFIQFDGVSIDIIGFVYFPSIDADYLNSVLFEVTNMGGAGDNDWVENLKNSQSINRQNKVYGIWKYDYFNNKFSLIEESTYF